MRAHKNLQTNTHTHTCHHLNSLQLAKWKGNIKYREPPTSLSLQAPLPAGSGGRQAAQCWDTTIRWTEGGAVWFGCCRKAWYHSGGSGVFRGSPCATIGSERNSEAQRRAAEFRGTDYKDWKHAKKLRLSDRVLQLWAYAWRISERKSNAHMLVQFPQLRVNRVLF